MIQFEGHLYATDASDFVEIVAKIGEEGVLHITQKSDGSHESFAWHDCKVSPRVGSIPRKIDLPDGRRIETTNNDAIDQIELLLRGQTKAHIAHQLERIPSFIAGAVLIAIMFGFALIRWGVPAAAESVAAIAPRIVLTTMTEQSLPIFDRFYFEETTLDTKRQDALTDGFQQIIAAADMPPKCCRLLYRASPIIGANAFALPDGTIVLTDELVAIAESDEEIWAVLAHEVAHVRERHSIRALLQASMISTLVIFVAGDLNQLGELAVGLPALLVTTGYSRAFEREADIGAAKTLRSMGLSPLLLAEILARMTAECGETCADAGWLSSHPSTPEREAYLRKL